MGKSKALGGITHKMLSNKLKELEADHLIIRHEYPGVPPKVEYCLSGNRALAYACIAIHLPMGGLNICLMNPL